MYVLSNTAMPGLVKIGFTTKVPTERAEELNTTGVPQPFLVEYYCLVDDPADLEARTHRVLHKSRHATGREFFRVEIATAIRTVEQLADGVEHKWYRVQQYRARPASVECRKCGAAYVSAVYCPKCRVKLEW